jgi:hypothetical protein
MIGYSKLSPLLAHIVHVRQCPPQGVPIEFRGPPWKDLGIARYPVIGMPEQVRGNAQYIYC